jgi:hypothetical protein
MMLIEVPFDDICLFVLDVVGVLTYVRHDKNIFPDGTTANTVTLKLTDNRY